MTARCGSCASYREEGDSSGWCRWWCEPVGEDQVCACFESEEGEVTDRPLLCLDAHIVRWDAPDDFTLLIGGSEVAYTARSAEEGDMLADLMMARKPLKVEIRIAGDSSP